MLKKFELAETVMYQVWAENEEEAKAMFWSDWEYYYSKKHNVSIFQSDKFPEKPQYWKDGQKKGKVCRFKREVPEGNPYSNIQVSRVIEENGERDPEVIEEIENILEEKLPARLKGSGIFDKNGVEKRVKDYDWEWDYQIGAFMIKACALGEDNFYDYGEDRKKPEIDIPEIAELVQKYPEYIYIKECCECCRCAGW